MLDDAIEDDESCAEALGEADDEVNERAEDVALDELRCPAVVSGNLVTTEEGNEPVRRGDERWVTESEKLCKLVKGAEPKWVGFRVDCGDLEWVIKSESVGGGLVESEAGGGELAEWGGFEPETEDWEPE